jgi:hypothetical protein
MTLVIGIVLSMDDRIRTNNAAAAGGAGGGGAC